MARELIKPALGRRGRQVPDKIASQNQWRQFVDQASGAASEPLRIPERRPGLAVSRHLGQELLRDLDPTRGDARAIPTGIKTGDWDQLQQPKQEDLFSQARQRLRRRLGAALLALTAVAGTALALKD